MTWERPAWTRAATVPQVTGDRLVVAGLLSLPAVAAAAVWIAPALLGKAGLAPEELRAAALALMIGGPVTALGGMVARTWFPRLLGLVLVSAFAGLLLAGRAILA